MVMKLKNKGIMFEHNDMPDIIRENDIHIFGNMKVAWIKEPNDNISNI
jgi:hypothetical protein